VIVSSLNPSILGQAVRFSATVKAARGAVPTGTVTFKNGGVAMGTATLSGGSAAFATSGLGVGSHSITATYNGGVGDVASTSAALVEVVKQ
jgi:hypothetical protein